MVFDGFNFRRFIVLSAPEDGESADANRDASTFSTAAGHSSI
jgi:hypothetical protein